MDPISIALASGAVGGVAGEMAKIAVDMLKARGSLRSDAANERAFDNVLRLIVDIQERIRRIESTGQPAPTQQLLDDPGTNAVFERAVLAASVSNSGDKRRLLGRAVAERLVAAPEGMHALASEQAVQVIPNLAREQLNLLAVAAFVYSIRPPAVDAIDGSEVNTKRLPDEERSAARDYAAWLQRIGAALDVSARPTMTDVAHLASTGCVVFERHVRRDFRKTLSPFGRRFVVAADSVEFDELIDQWTHRSRKGGDLYWYWSELVQHMLLTPVGLLIGVATFDEQTGENTSLVSVRRLLPEHDPIVEHPIWDGRTITLPFLDALSDAVRSLEERGVQPWRQYGKH